MEEEINAAVEWWCQQLREQPDHHAGDAELNAGIWMLALSLYSPLPEEKIQVFGDALRESLTLDYSQCILSTDYGPCGLLTSAAQYAEIDNANLRLPIKTMMWIEFGRVSVKCGYGAPVEVIYQ